MFDKYIHILTLKTIHLTIHQSQVATIAITADSPKRTELRQTVGHLHTADIPRMPNLVARFEIVQVLIVPVAVCIADDADSFHLDVR